MEQKEASDEERGKVVRAIEKNKDLIDLGYYGVPVANMAEKTLKAKEMMRNALSGLLQARMSFQLLQVGKGDEKEAHIEALVKAEDFFIEKYKIVFGEFEAVTMVPKTE